MPAVDAVLLDLGNVLVFHDDAHLYRRMAEVGGRSPEQVRDAITPLLEDLHCGRLRDAELRAKASAAIGAPLDQAKFDEIWNCHFTIHDDVLPLIESLFDRVKVVLLSNTNPHHIGFVRPLLPILERFDDLVLSYEVGLAKPDPAIFHEALRRTGTAATRTAYFDDVAAYIEAARSLGIQGHVFTDAPRFRQQLTTLGLPP